MTRAQQLAAMLSGIFEDDPWYAASIKVTLHGVTAVAAAARPLAGAHTIWEIAGHMDAWNHVCLRRLDGETVSGPPVDFAEPESISPEEWRLAQARLDESCRLVIARAARMTTGELAVKIGGKDYDADFLIEGIAQHWIYHSGQIAMLRKAV